MRRETEGDTEKEGGGGGEKRGGKKGRAEREREREITQVAFLHFCLIDKKQRTDRAESVARSPRRASVLVAYDSDVQGGTKSAWSPLVSRD